MDKRYSKENMLKKISELQQKLDAVFEAGENGIAYVGMANYAEREQEAMTKLRKAMYGEDS